MGFKPSPYGHGVTVVMDEVGEKVAEAFLGFNGIVNGVRDNKTTQVRVQ